MAMILAGRRAALCRDRGNPADAHRRAGAARRPHRPASAGGRGLRAGSEAEGFIEGRRKFLISYTPTQNEAVKLNPDISKIKN